MMSFSAFLSVKSTPRFPLDFWRWSFLPLGNSRCCCHSFNISEQHCIECISKNLQWVTLSKYKYSKLPLFIFWSTGIFGIPFLSFRAVSLPNKPLSKSFTISMEMLKKLSKKRMQWIFWRDSVFFNASPGPRFSSLFSFYPSTSQTDKGILFH